MIRAAQQIFLFLLLVALAAPLPSEAQALQVELEEFKRLAGELADLRESSQAQSRRITRLQSEVDSLRAALREANERSQTRMGDFVTREDLKKFGEAIQEVDAKRDADKAFILEQIKALEKVLTTPVADSRRSQSRPRESEPRPAETTMSTTVIPYKVQKGDFLSTIVAAYNSTLREKGLPRITLDDVKRANPTINIDNIYIGQEILLPVPEKGR